jgi:hypothetical protein
MDVETFIFLGEVFNSVFEAVNVQVATTGALGWISFNFPLATLNRADSETVIDLGPAVAPVFGPVINQILGASNGTATLTGGPFAQVVLWPQVPYFLGRPMAHPINTQLVRIYFNVHVSTPWPASDADATISYYIFTRLQQTPIIQIQGHYELAASVDGAWVTVDGGWPVSQAIADILGFGAQLAIPTVQKALDSSLALVAGKSFKAMYLIPGNGAKLPVVVGAAQVDGALALVS